MANDNETIEDIECYLRNSCEVVDGSGSVLDGGEFADRFLTAHKREMDGLRALVVELANALKKIDDMCDGDMCKYFDSTQHCSKCKYLNTCETGVAHSTLKTHESEISKAMEMIEKEGAKDEK